MAAAIGVIVVVAVLIVLSGLKVLKEYERAVVFRLGRLTPYRGPGVIFVIPIVERSVRLDLRTVTLISRPGRDHARQRHHKSQRGARPPAGTLKQCSADRCPGSDRAAHALKWSR